MAGSCWPLLSAAGGARQPLQGLLSRCKGSELRTIAGFVDVLLEALGVCAGLWEHRGDVQLIVDELLNKLTGKAGAQVVERLGQRRTFDQNAMGCVLVAGTDELKSITELGDLQTFNNGCVGGRNEGCAHARDFAAQRARWEVATGLPGDVRSMRVLGVSGNVPRVISCNAANGVHLNSSLIGRLPHIAGNVENVIGTTIENV